LRRDDVTLALKSAILDTIREQFDLAHMGTLRHGAAKRITRDHDARGRRRARPLRAD
jgi:hypothetical protein